MEGQTPACKKTVAEIEVDDDPDGFSPFDPSHFYLHESSERQDIMVNALLGQFALHMFAPWTSVVFLARSMAGAAASQFISLPVGKAELGESTVRHILLRLTFMSCYWIVPLLVVTAMWVCDKNEPYEGAYVEAIQALILFTLYCVTVAIKYSSLTLRECTRLRRARGARASVLSYSAQELMCWGEPTERMILCELELCAAAASTDLSDTWVVLRNRTDGTSVRTLWELYSRDINSLDLMMQMYPEIDKPCMNDEAPACAVPIARYVTVDAPH